MSNPLRFGKVETDMEIELIKRSIRLDRERLADTSSNLLIQKISVERQLWAVRVRSKKGSRRIWKS